MFWCRICGRYRSGCCLGKEDPVSEYGYTVIYEALSEGGY
jgi:hypothetical protein